MPSTNPCPDCQSPVDKTICTKSAKCERLLAYEDGEPDQYIFDEPIPTAEEFDLPNQPNPAGGGIRKELATKICEIEGCQTKIVVRGLCHKHYDLWRHGKLPGYPPFETIIQPKKQKKTAPKKTRTEPQALNLPEIFFFPVDLTDYPVMRNVITKTAARLMVPPQHVIISLMGEGLAARQQGAL